MRRPLSLLAAWVTGLLLAGCAAGADARTTSPDAEPSGDVVVYAAASLQSAFDDLAAAFTAAHPGLRVQLTFDGSSTLATQLVEGAPADVFAAADDSTMQQVVAEGLAAAPRPFATNTLTLVVPEGNPAVVTGLDDLAEDALSVVLCAPALPCGAAARQLLDEAGVAASVDSFEQNVTAVLTKVAVGEADAGLVYVTDAAARAAEVDTVRTAGADGVVNRYPMASLAEAANPAGAAAFVAFVGSAEARAVLADHGFGAP